MQTMHVDVRHLICQRPSYLSEWHGRYSSITDIVSRSPFSQQHTTCYLSYFQSLVSNCSVTPILQLGTHYCTNYNLL